MTRYPRPALFAADCCAEFFTRQVAVNIGVLLILVFAGARAL